MAIDLYWDDDAQTVILAEFQPGWTWDDLHRVLEAIKRMSADRERVFGAIIDVRKGLQIPGGSIFNQETLSQFKRITRLGSDGKGPAVIVGMNGVLQRVMDAIKMVDGRVMEDVYFAPDMAQARDVIYARMQNYATQINV